MREQINLMGTISDLIADMSEGNPGAINVLCLLTKNVDIEFEALHLILTLDDMNIRGSQIWVACKDHCEQDLKKFIECIRNRDKDMVDTINNKSGIEEKACVSGESFRRT